MIKKLIIAFLTITSSSTIIIFTILFAIIIFIIPITLTTVFSDFGLNQNNNNIYIKENLYTDYLKIQSEIYKKYNTNISIKYIYAFDMVYHFTENNNDMNYEKVLINAESLSCMFKDDIFIENINYCSFTEQQTNVYNDAISLYEEYLSKYHDSNYLRPLKKGIITNELGGFDATGNGHNGMDLTNYEITPSVYAINGGVVIKSEYHPINGNYIAIYHESDNKISIYAHLDKLMVKKGDLVDNQTIIGIMGNTGLSFGKHLHLQIVNGSEISYDMKDQINPRELINFPPKYEFFDGRGEEKNE